MRIRRLGPAAWAALAVLALIALAALVGPVLSPYSPTGQDLAVRDQGPSWAHPFGTASLGEDVLTRTLEAGRLECQAVAGLLSDAPIVGWKGSLGHTLGSSGLVELALAAQAIATGVTPGTLGAGGPTFVPQVAEQSFANRRYDGALCASNAFGGAQAALILRHV